ncbi:MAG: tRNA-dihydrouridine synthase [Methanobacteriaceae archaeon]|nr:tRNA-dihydrouridine synthase [Methanobacteriaceae archaeon]
MKVLSAMAGINDGEYCKKFTKQGIDILTIGGYNADKKSFQAALKIISEGRKEFLTCPNHLSEELSSQADIIHNYNPQWNGKINANIRSSDPKTYNKLSKIQNIDIIEVNAHCRQEPMKEAMCGESLLHNTMLLKDILSNFSGDCEISVKIRCNVKNVDIFKIIELIESYNVDYLHVDAMKPNIMHADYELLEKICNFTKLHVIGNNSVTCYYDYLKMLNTGVNSVSIARASLNGNVTSIFKK